MGGVVRFLIENLIRFEFYRKNGCRNLLVNIAEI